MLFSDYIIELVRPNLPIIYTTGAVCGGLVINSLRKRKFERLMVNCGLINKDKQIPLIIDKKTTEDKIVYILHLPAGLCMDDLEKQKEELQEQFQGSVIIERAPSGKVAMTIHKRKLGKMYPFEYIEEIGGKKLLPVEFAIGYSNSGVQVLSLEKNVHCGIGGATGSGKSVCLKTIITQAILKPKEELEISLIDLKRVEFGIFRRSSRIKDYADNVNGAMELLTNLTDMMYERLDLFAKYDDIVNIHEYNKRFRHKKLPFHLLVIDEFTLLKSVKGAHDKLEILLAECRATGISIVLSLQTHHADNLPSLLKVNILNVVAFKTKTEIFSRVLIESPDAAHLRSRGHGILKADDDVSEFQGFYVDSDMIKPLIQHTYIKKQPPKVEIMGVIPSATTTEREEPTELFGCIPSGEHVTASATILHGDETEFGKEESTGKVISFTQKQVGKKG